MCKCGHGESAHTEPALFPFCEAGVEIENLASGHPGWAIWRTHDPSEACVCTGFEPANDG